MIELEVISKTTAPDDEFSIFSQNIHTVHINFILGMCIHIFQAERLGGIARLFSNGYATVTVMQNLEGEGKRGFVQVEN